MCGKNAFFALKTHTVFNALRFKRKNMRVFQKKPLCRGSKPTLTLFFAAQNKAFLTLLCDNNAGNALKTVRSTCVFNASHSFLITKNVIYFCQITEQPRVGPSQLSAKIAAFNPADIIAVCTARAPRSRRTHCCFLQGFLPKINKQEGRHLAELASDRP